MPEGGSGEGDVKKIVISNVISSMLMTDSK
jgi:hypothetical protein